MPFAYYTRLSPARKATYRRSDRLHSVPIDRPAALWPLVASLSAALDAEDVGEIRAACQQLTDRLLSRLAAPPVQVVVLEVRPSNDYGELHGLYEPSDPPYRPRVSLWMRTAQRGRVVAFRTFLRTLLHELGHHLDYEVFGLEESFHTQGFYKRESSLFHQLVPPGGPEKQEPERSPAE
jgi:hypothetical protein